MTLSSTTSQKVLIFEVVELVNQVNEGLDVNVTIELTVDTSCYCILDLLYVISCAILGHPILDENYVNPRQKSWEQ